MKRLNVVVVSDFFFPDSPGGANRYAYQLAAGLAGRGHGVRVVARRARPGLPDRETLDGVEVVRVGGGRPASLADALAVVLSTAKALKHAPSPAVCILNQPITGLGALISGRRPLVYVFHSPWHTEYEIKAEEMPGLARGPVPLSLRVWARKVLEGLVVNRCAASVALSRYMAGLLERHHRAENTLSALIPAGVDPATFHPDEDRGEARKRLGLPHNVPVLFTLRNLRPRMGIENLLHALSLLRETGRESVLLVGGDGPSRGALESLSQSLGLTDRVRFLGFVPEEELPAYYLAADLFVLPTRRLEGFGIVILEALASSTPVLGTPVGAIPELLSVLGPEAVARRATARDLAASLGFWLPLIEKGGESYLNLRERCRELVLENYTIEHFVDRWERLLFDVSRGAG